MRAREILQEDYNASLDSDLTNLLVGAKAAGARQIATSKVVDYLYNMGYSISVDSIIPLLSNNPTVIDSSPEIINLEPPEVPIQDDDEQDDSDEKVEDLAIKAATTG